MSKNIKLYLVIGLVAVVAACAQQEEPPAPAPVMAEPVSSKY